MKKSYLLVIILLTFFRSVPAQTFLPNIDKIYGAGAQVTVSDIISINDSTSAIMGTFSDTLHYQLANVGDTFLANGSVNQGLFLGTFNNNGEFYHLEQIIGDFIFIPEKLLWQNNKIIATGGFASTNGADFDPSPAKFLLKSNMASNDIFVAKYKPDLSFDTAFSLGGDSKNHSGDRLYDVHADENGNIYMCGHFSGKTDFDPGTGVTILESVFAEDVFMAKYDSLFNLIWAKSVGGGGTDIAEGITSDTAENVYITGSFSLSVDFDPGISNTSKTSKGNRDGFILSLNKSGNFRWVQQQSATANVINTHIEAINNEIFVTGSGATKIQLTASSSDTLDFPANLNSAYLLNLSSTGNLLGKTRFRGYEKFGFSGLAKYKDILYLSGTFDNGFRITGSNQVLTSTTGNKYDLFLAGFNVNNGRLDWISTLGGTGFESPMKFSLSQSGITFGFGTNSDSFQLNPPGNTYFTARSNNLVLGRFLPVCTRDTAHLFLDLCKNDSIVINGEVIKNEGTFYQSIPGMHFCDSVIEINVTGRFPSFDTVFAMLCNKDSVAFGGNFISKPGQYDFKLTGHYGCDSNIFVTVAQTFTDTSVFKNDSSIVTTSDADSIMWFDCSAPAVALGDTNFFIPSATGSYAFKKWNNTCEIVSRCVYWKDLYTHLPNLEKKPELTWDNKRAIAPDGLIFSSIYHINGKRLAILNSNIADMSAFKPGFYILIGWKDQERHIYKIGLK